MKKKERLPVILSRLEVVRLLHRMENPKHQLLIALTYGAGLSVSEVVNLKVKDADLEQNVIHLPNRIAMLPKNLKVPLWRFMQKRQSEDLLFKSRRKGKMSKRTVQKIFEKALQTAGGPKKASFHSLRHSFAAHLVEAGIALEHIQKLLGHKNIRNTQIYTRLATVIPEKIQSPLERLGFLPAQPTLPAKFQLIR